MLIIWRFAIIAEADIEALALTEDGSILVVGDSLGYIHFFDYKTTTNLFIKVSFVS